MCKMDVTKLINLVRDRRPIWDQKDYNYKNRDVVKLLWDEVAFELDRPCEYAYTFNVAIYCYLNNTGTALVKSFLITV